MKKREEGRKGECLSERACLSDRERRFNRAEQYVDHDQRETVPILVRPRDDDDDHGDSGIRSCRTFVVDFRDADDGSPQQQSIRSNNTEIKSKYTRHANLDQ